MIGQRRIAITGMGLVGSYGLTADVLWSAQSEKDTDFGITTGYESEFSAAETVKADLRKMLRLGKIFRVSLIFQFAVAAVHLALTEAGMTFQRGTRNEKRGD